MLKSTPLAKPVSESLGRFFGWVPLHPNTITFFSIVFAAAGFVLFFYSQFLSGFIFFLLAFFLDAVDGAVARAKNLTSKKGAFLDGISDRLVEFFLILAFFISIADPTTQLMLVSILFFGTCMTSFVKAYAVHSGLLDNEAARRMPGILERAERSVLLLLGLGFWVVGLGTYLLPLLAFIAFLYAASASSYFACASRTRPRLYIAAQFFESEANALS